MVSERRAARAGLDRPQSAECEAPGWLWRFRSEDWGISWPPSEDNPVELGELMQARRRWQDARETWLAERGLVAQGMRGMTHAEWNRITREEPHRIVQRPSWLSGGSRSGEWS